MKTVWFCALVLAFIISACTHSATPVQVADHAQFAAIVPADTGQAYTIVRSKKPRHGHVYVVRNKAFGRNVYKVGITTQKDPQKRVKALQGSGVPYPFRVVYLVESDDVFALERATHAALDKYRMADNREFFRVKKKTIIDTVDKIKGGLDKK